MTNLVLERLAKTYPDGTPAVRGVDLTAEDGELVVLLGPSGCGKTTTLRMAAGLERASSGRIALGGRDVTDLPPQQRDVGFVFQFYALYPHFTVEQNIAFPLECAGVGRRERARAARELARELAIEELLPRRPRELAPGDRQRVGLARAMIRRPKLWLMDEPLGSLDAAERAAAGEFLRREQRRSRVTTLYVTHDQEEALALADRVVVMDQGRVAQVGSPRQVHDDPATLFVARFVGSPGMNLIEGRLERGAFRTAGGPSAPVELDADRRGKLRDGPCVLGVRPEHVRVAPGGPLAGRVTADAFVGPWRNVRVEGAFGRAILRRPAHERTAIGAEIALALEPGRARIFDPASGARIA
jgi:multiple sugar transport system ATP-binding protein